MGDEYRCISLIHYFNTDAKQYEEYRTNPLLLHPTATATKAFVPALHKIFDSSGVETKVLASFRCCRVVQASGKDSLFCRFAAVPRSTSEGTGRPTVSDECWKFLDPPPFSLAPNDVHLSGSSEKHFEGKGF
jgi:hypothetical protein